MPRPDSVPPDVQARLDAVQARIDAACAGAGRDPAGVRLVAISKTFPSETVRAVYAAGQHVFGENYVQEGVDKLTALADLPGPAIEWHFIGPLQSNKTRPVAEHFAWVHGIDRLKIAERLSEQRPADLPPLNVCIQVNVSGEESKSGITPAQAAELAHAIAGLPRLKLRGLMAIPPPSRDPAQQRRHFAAVRELKAQLTHAGIMLDTLSMGMSADLEAAVAEGATIVRVGTALFGARNPP